MCIGCSKEVSSKRRLKLKCSADQSHAIKFKFVSLDLLQVAIRSFSNNWHSCAPANKKDVMLKRSLMENPL